MPLLQPGWRQPPWALHPLPAVFARRWAVFAFAAHSATRGQRDFSSVRGLAATRYDLIAREGTVDRARTMLRTAGLLPDQTDSTIP